MFDSFMSGLTGALFTEFAFYLWSSDYLGGNRTDTLTMMCSHLLRTPNREGGSWQDRMQLWLDRQFVRLHGRYEKPARHALISSR